MIFRWWKWGVKSFGPCSRSYGKLMSWAMDMKKQTVLLEETSWAPRRQQVCIPACGSYRCEKMFKCACLHLQGGRSPMKRATDRHGEKSWSSNCLDLLFVFLFFLTWVRVCLMGPYIGVRNLLTTQLTHSSFGSVVPHLGMPFPAQIVMWKSPLVPPWAQLANGAEGKTPNFVVLIGIFHPFLLCLPPLH